MYALRFILGLLLVLLTLMDGFETILLPRRINHRFRYARLYYRAGWAMLRAVAVKIKPGKWREAMLAIFGPMSLIGLFASWMVGLVLGFALLQWSTVNPLLGPGYVGWPNSFYDCLYFSGTTCFTLGLGDLTPRHGMARALTVAECGVGFGFLAIIISYLPVLYQAFSRREVTISLLDARAGSPPTGGEYLLRLAHDGRLDLCDEVLRDWERWCAELLESQISFPVLTYYRSQHSNQSWLSALATMLDASALLLTTLPARDTYQAQLTFAMARHAAVDISLIFLIRPHAPPTDRLPPGAKERMSALMQAQKQLDPAVGIEPHLADLRGMYEPFLQGLADHFLLSLPPLLANDRIADNWQRSAWMPRTPGIGSLPAGKSDGDHFG